MATTQMKVTKIAVMAKSSQLTKARFVPAVTDIPAIPKAEVTTCVQTVPITNAKAVPSEVAIVLRNSLRLNSFAVLIFGLT